MRQIMKLFITSFLFILFSGCTKDVYDPSDKIPGEGTNGSPDKPGGLSIQLCKSEKKEFYIR
ncbi:hypothetical protein, partial [Parabacteroides distasonis]|uniref:hypothetical protein n=1 Tax=Parabacteroides distasonis TaxID=823 RepID=UPI0034A1E0EE